MKHTPKSVAVLIPVFNDWESVGALIHELDGQFNDVGVNGLICLVNDGSTELVPDSFRSMNFTSVSKLTIVHQTRNLGHQRAITVGLHHINAAMSPDYLIVMDGDGEDQPADAVRLLETAENNRESICFASRSRRSEGFFFKLFYIFFKALFKLLTGAKVKGGNFSCFHAQHLSSILSVSEIWNHYAAAIIKARFDIQSIDCQRGTRISGRSRMNFHSLVIHGLSAISVFSDMAGVRMIIACMVLTAISFAGICTTVIVRLYTNLAIQGWATYTTGLLFVIMLQAAMMSLAFCFIVLTNRNAPMFVPIRDAGTFIAKVEDIFSR